MVGFRHPRDDVSAPRRASSRTIARRKGGLCSTTLRSRKLRIPAPTWWRTSEDMPPSDSTRLPATQRSSEGCKSGVKRPRFGCRDPLPLRFSALLRTKNGGDRRGSNPHPSEPQSDDICCHGLPCVAKSAYLSRIVCWRLPTVAACCALGGVSSGVNFTLALARHCCPRAVRFGSVMQALPYAWVESPSC